MSSVERLSIIGDGVEISHAELVILNESVSIIVFCFDQEGLIDTIDYFTEYLSEGKANTFCDFAIECGIKEFSEREPIPIPGVMGRITAECLTALRSASNLNPRVWSFVPANTLITLPSYYLSYVPVESHEEMPEDNKRLFNSLLMIPDEDSMYATHLIRSKQQFENLVSTSRNLSTEDKMSLEAGIHAMILPSISDLPVVTISGSLGNDIAMAHIYRSQVEMEISALRQSGGSSNAEFN